MTTVLQVVTPAPEEFETRIKDWFRAWVPANERWEWPFADGGEVHFFEEFAGEPFDIRCAHGKLSFSLEGRAASKWWKDWLGFRIVKELREAFPEITGIDKVVNCNDR